MKTLITTLLTLVTLLSISASAQDMSWKVNNHLGADGQDRIRTMAADEDGNTYLLMEFSNTVALGTSEFTSYGQTDVALVKTNALGEIFWAKQLGGPVKDYGYGIAVSDNGRIAITGSFSEQLNIDDQQLIASGATDAYIAVFSNDGSVDWTRTIGGKYYDYASDIHFDNEGNLLVSGWFSGITTFTSYAIESTNHNDGFLAKYNSAGDFEWVVQFEGEGPQVVNSISTDASNNYYVGGQFENTMTVSGTEITSSGFYDAFVLKTDADGNTQWIEGFGGEQSDNIYTIRATSAGDVYAAGYFAQSMFVESTEYVAKGFDDGFALKLNTNGQVEWSTQFGASGWEYARSIDVNSGMVAVGGYFSGSITIGSEKFNAFGGEYDYDQFTAFYSSTDGQLLDAVTMGGNNSDFTYDVIADVAQGGFYVAGEFYGTHQFENSITNSAGNNDGIVLRYGPEPVIEETTPLFGFNHTLSNDTLQIHLSGTDAQDVHYLSGELGFNADIVRFLGATTANPSQHLSVAGLQNTTTVGFSIGKMSSSSVTFGENALSLIFVMEDNYAETADFTLTNLLAENATMESMDVLFETSYSVTLNKMLAVWPGDANNDLQVCEQDVLALAYNWGSEGEARTDGSVDWTEHIAQPWADTNATFSDTDGSGKVDHNDLRAITYNFGSVCDTDGQQQKVRDNTNEQLSETDNVLFEMSRLNTGETATITLTSNSDQSILGVSARIILEGLDEADYTVRSITYGSWAQDWLADYQAIEFQRTERNLIALALAKHGKEGKANLLEGEMIAEIEIEALTNWTAPVPVGVENMSVTQENGQANTETIGMNSDRRAGFETAPERIKLFGNYPNPFNPSTQISFELPENMEVNITIYNAMGQKVATLLEGQLAAGSHSIPFSAENLASGTYLYQLQADGYQHTEKMTLVK